MTCWLNQYAALAIGPLIERDDDVGVQLVEVVLVDEELLAGVASGCAR